MKAGLSADIRGTAEPEDPRGFIGAAPDICDALLHHAASSFPASSSSCDFKNDAGYKGTDRLDRGVRRGSGWCSDRKTTDLRGDVSRRPDITGFP